MYGYHSFLGAGQETRPYRGVRRNTAEPDSGRGKPLPYETVGKHSLAENRRAAHGAVPTAISGPFIAYGDTESVS